MSGSQSDLGCKCPRRTEATISATELQSPHALVRDRPHHRPDGQKCADDRFDVGGLDVALGDKGGARDGLTWVIHPAATGARWTFAPAGRGSFDRSARGTLNACSRSDDCGGQVEGETFQGLVSEGRPGPCIVLVRWPKPRHWDRDHVQVAERQAVGRNALRSDPGSPADSIGARSNCPSRL